MSAQCWEAFFWNVGVACNLPQQWEYLYRAPAFLPQLAFNSPLVSICIVFCIRCHWRYVPSDFFFPYYFILQGRVLLSLSLSLTSAWGQLSSRQGYENYTLPFFCRLCSICHFQRYFSSSWVSAVKLNLCWWLHGEMSNCLPSCWEFLIDLSNKCSVIVLGSHVQHGATALMPSVPAHILSWTTAWF